MGWFQLLKDGLKKTSSKVSQGITDIISKKKLDAATLEELEELLISINTGVETSSYIISELSKSRFGKEVSEDEIKEKLAEIIEEILSPSASNINFLVKKPHVVLVCGVNGNGKTTTIGKITHQYISQGYKVAIAACDTFRAAAQEQLQVWADRSGATLIGEKANADPASVAYKAYEYAKNNNYDILLIDTAGRMANNKPLMDELSKINRVIKKIDDAAPHDTILVLDSITGQNAIKQVESFQDVTGLTGLIITKLDCSPKAGIVVALAHKFKIPIIAISVGEKIEDLNAFNPKEFAKGLVGAK